MPVATKRVRASKLKPEERKQLLLKAAVSTFAKNGIGATKHVDVAKEAGVAAPTVFSYFPSREALTEAVLEEVGQYVVNSIIDVAPAEEDPLQRTYLSALETIRLSKARPDYVRVWLMWSTHFAPQIQSRYRHYESIALDRLSAMMAEDTSKAEDAQHLRDRARMILGSSTFLHKMILDGVSEERQKDFVQHIVSFVGA